MQKKFIEITYKEINIKGLINVDQIFLVDYSPSGAMITLIGDPEPFEVAENYDEIKKMLIN